MKSVPYLDAKLLTSIFQTMKSVFIATDIWECKHQLGLVPYLDAKN